MARIVRTVPYLISNVTSLQALLDMMRYDGMRFSPSTNMSAIRILSRNDAGVIDPADDSYECKVYLLKDQVQNWQPTEARWQSFRMDIRQQCDFGQCSKIN